MLAANSIQRTIAFQNRSQRVKFSSPLAAPLRALLPPNPISTRNIKSTSRSRLTKNTMASTTPTCDVNANVTVLRITDTNHLEKFKTMTRSYLEWLAEDLCFQGIEEELASLPGCYAEQTGGTMLLAFNNNNTIGAVALRPLSGKQTDGLDIIEGVPVSKIAEMKRLFVLPEYQGTGVGCALATAVIEEAIRLGYTAMVLDTLERLTGANKLYQRLDFKPCEPYNYCPLPGVLYWMKHF